MLNIFPSAWRTSGLAGWPVLIASTALLAGLLAYILIWSPNFNDQVPGGDYVQFYVAARIVREGGGDRLYDFPYQVQFQHDPGRMPVPPRHDVHALYIYPPFFVWFCLPFSYLPFKAGAAAWVLLMAGCLVAALHIIVGVTARGREATGFALLAAVPFLPTLMSIYSCQNATLSLLILSGTYALLRRGHPMAAGLVFALQAFKPQLALVIGCAMLCKGQWRFVIGAALGGLVLLAASLAVSPTASVRYLSLGPSMSRWIDMPGMPLTGMACWQGFWRLVLGDRPLRDAQMAAAVTSFLTIIPLVRCLRGSLDTVSDRFAWQFAALVLGTILISPHLLYYDLTLLLLPMVLVACSPPVATPHRMRDALWPWCTAILYAAVAISPTVAAVTRVQVIVPVSLLYLILLAEAQSASGPCSPCSAPAAETSG